MIDLFRLFRMGAFAWIIGLGVGSAMPAAAQDIVVVVHGPAGDPFWATLKNGAEAAAKETGAKVEFHAPETQDARERGMGEMRRAIDAAAKRRPDGLVVSIPDAEALGPAIERAVAAGIPVISTNSGSRASKKLGALLHVGQDDYAAGKVAGAKMGEMGGKNAICVTHDADDDALDRRCEGFAVGFGGIVEIIPVGPADEDQAEIQARIRAALDSNPDVDTVMALDASATGEAAVAAVNAKREEEGADAGAVEDEGNADEAFVATNVGAFGMTAGFLKSVVGGDAAFAVDPQPYLQGYLPVALLSLHARFGLIPGGDMPSGPNLITADKAGRAIALSAKGLR